MQIAHRWAPSLGELESSPELVWGTKKYNPETDKDIPCVFFGLYGLPDFYELWRHRGTKYILWAGSDIRHFRHGYWLDDKGEIRLFRDPLAQWINKNCESFVENEVEHDELQKFGIESKIVPSFLGNVNNFQITYKQSDKPKVYTSVSGDDFSLYGWDVINDIAEDYPDVEFHMYGNKLNWHSDKQNIFVHGRVPKEQMNEEIKDMQGALRMVALDGFSEILAKSVLMGQWPISIIRYPHMLKLDDLATLKDRKEPNVAGREYYLLALNNFPWNLK